MRGLRSFAAGSTPGRFRPAVEHLEVRLALSGSHAMGVMAVPGMASHLAEHPTVSAARSGAWSDPATWSHGMVPAAGDVVSIADGVTVRYDAVSDARLDAVVLHDGGQLLFRTDADTRLLVVNLLVLEGGYLEVGTPERPVAAGVKAEIVFADRPIDTMADPEQFGNGLVAFGKVTMHGAAKDLTFARLAVEPRPGDTTLTFARPVTDWQVGDRLVLPPTGGVSMFFEPRSDEELVVAAVAGNVVTLAAPLQGVHEGGRDAAGNLDFLPHVGNLSRNVVLRSENPAGTRGHTMFTGHAEVDIRYVAFKDLGRTAAGAFDSTTFNEMGMVTHVGANQAGRYSLHLHKLLGPDMPGPTGQQYLLIGNAIDGGLRWGLVIHGTHSGLVKDTVAYRFDTAGLVTEDGSESYNVIEHNFVTGVDKGDAYWLEGSRNYFRDNVAGRANNGYYLPPTLGASVAFEIPLRGNDHEHTETFKHIESTFLEFARNEAYAVRAGLYLDHRHGGESKGGHYIKDFRVWSSFGSVHWGIAAFHYDTGGIIYDGLVSRGASVDVYSDARTVIRNADIQGADVGVRDNSQNGTLIVENSYLRNNTNIRIVLSPSASAGPIPTGPIRTTLIRDVKHEAPPGKPLRAIQLTAKYFGESSRVPTLGNVVEVVNHDQVRGDDFRLYFEEQRADALVPFVGDIKDDPIIVKTAAPERGLTNRQAWDKYGIAVGGAVAPADAIRREGIEALVAPVARPAPSPAPAPPAAPAAIVNVRPVAAVTAAKADAAKAPQPASPLARFYGYASPSEDPLRRAAPPPAPLSQRVGQALLIQALAARRRATPLPPTTAEIFNRMLDAQGA